MGNLVYNSDRFDRLSIMRVLVRDLETKVLELFVVLQTKVGGEL